MGFPSIVHASELDNRSSDGLARFSSISSEKYPHHGHHGVEGLRLLGIGAGRGVEDLVLPLQELLQALERKPHQLA